MDFNPATNSSSSSNEADGTITHEVQSLSTLCLGSIISTIEHHHHFSVKSINELCRICPTYLLDPLLTVLLEKGALTDVALLSFLVPGRIKIEIPGVSNIKNSTFKLIGLNCPSLMVLDLSGIARVNNGVVRAVLRGCSVLSDLRLDRCVRVTDQAFDPSYSPFEILQGCFSIESISLQGCPQVTGDLVATLNKMCRKLKHLNLSQCKQIAAPAIRQIFEHNRLAVLNLAFMDNVSDDAFATWPIVSALPAHAQPAGMTMANISSCTSSSERYINLSPLQILNLGKSTITDLGMSKMAHLGRLEEIRLQWCIGITDFGIELLTINCPMLRVIDLKSCTITDAAVGSIAKRSQFLTTLDLSWCYRLTDAALTHLSSISSEYERECALEHLIIVWCAGFTERGVMSLSHISSLKVLECSGSLSGTASNAPCFEIIRAAGVRVIQA